MIRKPQQPIMKRCGALCGMLVIALLSVQGQAALAQQQHTLPLVKPLDSAQQGFVRIINRSDSTGTVTIHAIDDDGMRSGPITFELAAKETKHFNSGDLEGGNAEKGLSGNLGDGEGDWRLELTTELDIEPLAYIRTSQGFLTSMHDIVPPQRVGTPGADDNLQYHVRFFNPGSNRSQQSLLRVINVAGIDNEVTITALDDDGEPGGEVRFTLGPYAARTISAETLEDGTDDLEGSLGDGSKKWQLTVTAEIASPEERRAGRPIQVMSLMHSTGTGNLTNLSATGAGNDSNRGGAGIDWLWGGDGDDILNPGDSYVYDGTQGSAGDDTIVYTDSGPGAFQWLGYVGLDNGIAATINGVTNVGTVDKGSSGSDTIVDIVNPLNAAFEPPSGGAFGLGGTDYDDTFDLTLEGGQWMEVRGEAGDDRITIRSGRVRVNYRHTLDSVEVDLEAGRANDDGYGGVDTFVGTVYEVQGGPGDDTLEGSDGADRFRGGPGNDTFRGGDGNDRLYGDEGNDILWGGDGEDRLYGDEGNDILRGDDDNDQRDRFYGGPGDDVIHAGNTDWDTGGSNQIHGSAGNDRIVFSASTGPRSGQALSYAYSDLGTSGITVTIDGITRHVAVDKGPNGTDTIVDVGNVLDIGGLSVEGTRSDDVFDLTFDENQWTGVSGGAGNDTFNIHSGGQYLRIVYTWPRTLNGIDLDLEAGRANDDGFGDVDTIRGQVWEIRGTDLSDVIRGSSNDESFIGRRGDDVIDGRGGYDQLRFDRSGVRNVTVDLEEGAATGIWGDRPESYTIDHLELEEERLIGSVFRYRISNIERIRGSNGDDILRGSSSDDRLEGRRGDDEIEGRSGNDDLRGEDGDDVFIFGRGHGEDVIRDFTDGDDLIIFVGLDISSKNDVLNNAHAFDEGVGVWIDLRNFGGGTLSVSGISRDRFDATDFLF